MSMKKPAILLPTLVIFFGTALFLKETSHFPFHNASKDSVECNPFAENGRLHVDLEDPRNTAWRPFDKTCPPSTYLSNLYRKEGDKTPLIPPPPAEDDESYFPTPLSAPNTRQYLPWLANRTILIHGDSIDRYHLKDLCSLIQGRLFLVTPDHPASPPSYHQTPVTDLDRNGEETSESKERSKLREGKERFWAERPYDGLELTNPWVCDIEEYGATLISVFNFGLEGGEHFYEGERWYHGPASWIDRLHYITKPLLVKLARHLDRPQIMFPDLVEINSGFWDLRRYTEEDFVAAGFKSRPYPEDSGIPYTNLSPGRESSWEREAIEAIKEAARVFTDETGSMRKGPTLLWRTLHHPHRHNYTPFPRVFALDSLGRKVVKDLQTEHHSEDFGFDERLRVDDWGFLMSGQEHHFRDMLHPHAVPGSYLWGDMILYELKRAVERIGRS